MLMLSSWFCYNIAGTSKLFLASSTKERQQWISHLRGVVHHFTAQIAQEHPPLSNQRKPRTASFKAQISTNLTKLKGQYI